MRDGMSAGAVPRTERFDLVILDRLPPDRGGKGLCARIAFPAPTARGTPNLLPKRRDCA